jgi:hypothetical protein
MQLGFSAGLGSNLTASASWYNLHPTQMPKAASRSELLTWSNKNKYFHGLCRKQEKR